MKRSFCRLSIGLLLFSLAGCGGGTSSTQPAPTASNRTAAEKPAEASNAPTVSADVASAEDVTVQVKDFDGVVELIKRKPGKVVVMDCWSTWCEPCMKEFHGLVELHKKFGPERVACVSLCCNYSGAEGETPTDEEPAVLKFLSEQGATFDNILSSTPAEDLFKLAGFTSGTVPAVFIYDQQGALARQFEGKVNYKEIGKLVEQLVGKSAAEPAAETQPD